MYDLLSNLNWILLFERNLMDEKLKTYNQVSSKNALSVWAVKRFGRMPNFHELHLLENQRVRMQTSRRFKVTKTIPDAKVNRVKM